MLIAQGHRPQLQILDNECSQELKDAFAKYHIAFQCVSPKEHHANAAERSIRTFMNHFIATLCTVDYHFPLTEWDHLLPQTLLSHILLSPLMHLYLATTILIAYQLLLPEQRLLLTLRLKLEPPLASMAKLAGTLDLLPSTTDVINATSPT
jgi:hypothetical protein